MITATGYACPSCGVGEFHEWHLETPQSRSGGRWCPACGYGVHPPPPVGD